MITASSRGRLKHECFTVSQTRCSEPHAAGEACEYKVAWEINPHMRRGSVSPLRAQREHCALIRCLQRAGAHVEQLPFVHGAFDSVFMKDSAVFVAEHGVRRALLATFASAERQQEQGPRAIALGARGFDIRCPSRHPLEGGDTARFRSGEGLLGYGFRSSALATSCLESFWEAPVLPLELVDPWLYHLDTALTVLNDGTVLCCRDAFSSGSLRRLERHPALTELLFVPRAEALRFSLNLIQIGSTVVTGTADAPVTKQLLSERGLSVLETPLPQFHLAGGSAACLVGKIYDDAWRTATRETTAMRSTSEQASVASSSPKTSTSSVW